MSNRVWMAAVAASALGVSGCGGEDSAPPPVSSAPSPTPSPSPSPTLPATPLFSVSTLTPVTYPNGYTVPTTNPLDFNTDPCRLDLDVVTYPQSWLRGRTLPQATGAPLDPAIGRGVLIKDIMLDDNPAFVLSGSPDAPNGCNNGAGALKIELDKTAKRLAGLGAGYVKITQWNWITENSDGSFRIVDSDEKFGPLAAPLSNENLRSFVESAHRVGLKVVVWNQIQAFGTSDGAYVPPPPNNTENYQKWFAAFAPFMERRARFYESIGVDVWDLGCDFCVFNTNQEKSESQKSLFYNNYLQIARNVKSIFKGQSYIAANDWFGYGSEFIDLVNFLEGGIFSNKQWSLAESDSLTSQSYKETLQSNVFQLLPLGKPLFLSIGIQSRRNALTEPGYLEETGCTAAVNSMPIDDNNCIQKQTETDFALQAIVIQGQLEYIKSLNVKNITVFASDYFVTDNLYPQQAYPNIGYTIRNKPAEGVVREWFRK